jgi:hypothetical protein
VKSIDPRSLNDDSEHAIDPGIVKHDGATRPAKPALATVMAGIF